MNKSFVSAVEKRKKGRISKVLHYFAAYDTHLKAYKNKKINLLEIGVGKGGSLWAFSNYFPKAKIVGIDIRKECKKWAGENVAVYTGDQRDKKLLTKVSRVAGPFDIIVDDGGHTMEQQITSFETLFPLLADGGVYVIEDLHTSFWPEWQGKLHGKVTTVEFLKSLVEKLTFWAYMHPYAKHTRVERNADYYEKNISSIHFYDSLCFVCKLKKQLPIVYENGNLGKLQGDYLR